MKCKSLLTFALALVMISSVACSRKTPDKVVSKYNIDAKTYTKPVEKINIASNKVAFKMLNATFSGSEGVNTVISPLSLSIILSVTQNGASGSTKEDMQKALELSGTDDATINGEYKNIIANFNSIEALKVKMANSIWIDKGTKINEEFKNIGRDYYEAEINDVDFSNSKTIKTINNWVSDHTAGKIKEVIVKLANETTMVLINTLYFKGDWAIPFKKENTKKSDFNLSNGTTCKVDMMNGDIYVDYLKGDSFKAIRLPYKDKNFGMYIFLPSGDSSTQSLMKEMNYENWNKWKEKLNPKMCAVQLPKFHIEYEQELNKMLKDFGMESAFKPGADFSKMGKENDLFISLVKQKCYIDVDEKGTEAAAATVVTMDTTSAPPSEIEKFIVDRPFIYAITDSETDSILFMGTVENP